MNKPYHIEKGTKPPPRNLIDDEFDRAVEELQSLVRENKKLLSDYPLIMEDMKYQRCDHESYFVGVDFAYPHKWWQRALVWLGFRNRWQDYSCSTVWKKNNDGTLEVVDIDFF